MSKEIMHVPTILFGLLRIALGGTFFWAFIDKLFGLGFATAADKAWLDGVSPTVGFLKFGTHGPFATLFQAMAGNIVVDWVFMMGLLLIGISLILGIGVKIASYSGALLLFFMWLAVLPPKNNPVIDDHIIYILVLLAFAKMPVGEWIGFGGYWKKIPLVKSLPILE